jgi:hypothetical protein
MRKEPDFVSKKTHKQADRESTNLGFQTMRNGADQLNYFSELLTHRSFTLFQYAILLSSEVVTVEPLDLICLMRRHSDTKINHELRQFCAIYQNDLAIN